MERAAAVVGNLSTLEGNFQALREAGVMQRLVLLLEQGPQVGSMPMLKSPRFRGVMPCCRKRVSKDAPAHPASLDTSAIYSAFL